MNQVRELERLIGVELPASYREYLLAATGKFLDNEIVFKSPRSGVVDEILTVEDVLANDKAGQIGIPDRSLMHIGGNLLGGYLYLDVSDKGFGKVLYMENYVFKETFPSFEVFLSEPVNVAED